MSPLCRGALAALALFVGVIAPGEAQRTPNSTQAQPITLRSTGLGRWGPPITAIEEHRVLGAPGAGQFGIIADIASLPDGGAVVFDAKGADGPAIYEFDRDGAFVRRFGRTGGGPGEYGGFISYGDLYVDRAGTIYLHDPGNHRIDRWKADGTLLPSWPLPPSNQGPLFPKLLAGGSGDLYIAAQVALNPSHDAFNYENDGYIHVNAEGVVMDTVQPPTGLQPPVNSRWSPQDYWTLMPGGDRIRFRSSVLGFAVLGRRGDTVLSVTRPVAAEHFSPVERVEQEALLAWGASLAAGIPTPHELPSVKPPYYNVWEDPNQRFWFGLHVRAVSVAPFPAAPGQHRPPPPMISQVEPEVFAAFASSGQYLGEVHFPMGTRQVSFRDDIAWGVLETPGDEVVLVKWRLPGARKGM